jgi:F-type H+-transporting ATPase subunit gamma
LQHLKIVEGAGQKVDTTMVGKKGDAYFRFLGREVSEQNTEIGDKVTFDQVEPLANRLIQRFVDGEIDAVHVAYTRFYSVGKQSPELLQLLPLEPVSSEPVADAPESGNQAASGGSQRNVEYEFSPAPQALLDDLLPASFRIRLFQSFTDAEVSEQVARMVAMKAATDAAGDMITSLTRKYNRARQTHITMELLDIIGGASALE